MGNDDKFQLGYRAGMIDILSILRNCADVDSTDTQTLESVREFVETGLGLR